MNVEELLSGQTGGRQDTSDTNSPLQSLRTDLDFYRDAIREVADELIAADYSAYPIFIAHQHQVSIGEVILDSNELNTAWTIHVSTLEEFVEKGIIKEERTDYFIKQYKPADRYMCLFVIVPQGANFVFYPYK